MVPFKPGIGVSPGTDRTDSPAGATVEVTVPFEPLLPIAHSNVRTARTALPLGMGLNPSAAEGLAACTDAQFGKGTRNPVACPAASKIGTVAVETPPLPPGSLTGDVFLGKQLSRDPASGEEYRIFVDAESARYGVSARLIGNVAADPKTGRLTTTFAENPQVPFSSFKLHFNEGQRAPLSSPPICGPNESIISADPWSRKRPRRPPRRASRSPPRRTAAPVRKRSASGPSRRASRRRRRAPRPAPTAPSRSTSPARDGQQEVKGVDVTLPAGLSGKLKGIPYCKPSRSPRPPTAPATAEEKNSSCPSKSLVGAATIRAGTGSARSRSRAAPTSRAPTRARRSRWRC